MVVYPWGEHRQALDAWLGDRLQRTVPNTVPSSPSDTNPHQTQEQNEEWICIFIDGTWESVKRIHGGSRWLRSLPHVVLDAGVSIYDAVKKEPRVGCVSTVEAMAACLRVCHGLLGGEDGGQSENEIDGRPKVDAAEILVNVLRQWVEQQCAFIQITETTRD